MARAEFGSAKHQSKQLKASGLQRLRYYCQLCLKQCRDANGFKNHLLSKSHTGRISNLSSEGKGGSVVAAYSADFEKDFLKLLKINHGTKKINANRFYQEYILNDKNHVHMNATRWPSLTSFVKYLGRLGKVRVEMEDEDEFNLVISLVDSSSELRAKMKERTRQTDEEQAMRFIQAQVARGQRREEEEEEEKEDDDENGKKENNENQEGKIDTFTANQGKEAFHENGAETLAPKPLLLLKGLRPKRKGPSAFHD